MRKTTLLWLLLAVICGTGIFHTSQRVHDEREKIASLDASIAKEQESIRVLNAEWSYLNQPARLEKLARTYLHLAPLKGSQFVKLETISPRGTADADATPAAKEKKVIISAMPPTGGIRPAAKPQLVKAHAMHALPDPALRRGGKIIKMDDDEDDSDDQDQAEEQTRPVRKTTTASTHNFSDLMKNLRSGVE